MIWYRVILHIFAILLLGVLQISMINNWPTPINNFNLLLTLVIFLTIIISYKMGLVWAIGAGLVVDLFSPTLFGVSALSLIITTVVINFLFNNFFTNRSVYSLLSLGLSGVIVYNFFLVVGENLFYFFGFTNNTAVGWSLLNNIVWQVILGELILLIIFFMHHFSTGRLRASFLISE